MHTQKLRPCINVYFTKSKNNRKWKIQSCLCDWSVKNKMDKKNYFNAFWQASSFTCLLIEWKSCCFAVLLNWSTHSTTINSTGSTSRWHILFCVAITISYLVYIMLLFDSSWNNYSALLRTILWDERRKKHNYFRYNIFSRFDCPYVIERTVKRPGDMYTTCIPKARLWRFVEPHIYTAQIAAKPT